QRIELKSSSLIKKLNYLPKEYKIQLLAAIIVDEGSVLKSNIKIYNTNLKIMKELKQLIESLGYSCSAIKINKRRHKKILIIKGQEAKMNYDLHIIWIHAASLLKFKEDLDKTIKKYGNIAGLWHKQKDLIKWGERVDLKRIKKTKMSKKKIIPLIKKEIKKNPLKVLEFAKEQDLDYIRAYKLFFRLKQKGKIKKISTGVFASNNYII
ncbi:MAG: hypothetical protein L6408_02145, partial [Nanoarchaeota archaeon]|nr:hypothetical protein [Nanoarchaeota archaeon]